MSRVLERGERWVLKMGSDGDIKTRSVLEEALTLFREYDLRLIIVHGGSEDIDQRLATKGIPTQKKDGLRVTTSEVLEVVLASLAERNAKIVQFLEEFGQGFAVPFFGHQIAQGRRYSPERGLGLVGRIVKIEDWKFQSEKKIPVISTGCRDFWGQTLNVNADAMAAEVARAFSADKLIFTGKTPGVLLKGELIKKLEYEGVYSLLAEGNEDITGGMVPKLKESLWALEQENPPEVHICQTSGQCLRAIAQGEAPGTLITIGGDQD